MKRSSQVTLVLLGSAGLASYLDHRTVPPRPPQPVAESLPLPVAKPRCERPDEVSLAECHDPQTASGTTAGSSPSGGHGGYSFWLLRHTSSLGPSTPPTQISASAGPTMNAAEPAGTTRFGGFGSIGRTMARFGGGS